MFHEDYWVQVFIHRVSEKSSTLHLAPYVRQILTEFNTI